MEIFKVISQMLLSDPFIFWIFIISIIATAVACTMVIMIDSGDKQKYGLPILPDLRGKMDFNLISIEESGDSHDDLLTNNKVVKTVIKRVEQDRRLRILVFSTVISHDNSDRMIKLLQTCSLLNIDIHYVSSTMAFPGKFDLEKFLHSKQLRADKILKRKDNIVMEDFEQYDIILHHRAGLKSAYEILVGVIEHYKNEQNRVNELERNMRPHGSDE